MAADAIYPAANIYVSDGYNVRTPLIRTRNIESYGGVIGDIKDHNFIMRPSGGQIVSKNNNGHGSIVNINKDGNGGGGPHWNNQSSNPVHASAPYISWGNNLTKNNTTGLYGATGLQHGRYWLH